MASNDCTQYYTQKQCIDYLRKYVDDDIQLKLDSTMPFIGLYIAAASAACVIATAADVVNASRNKKLWFPCKYFSLNAFSLTVLAVAMKLPVDLTSKMWGVHDRLSRVSGLVLMSTSMANNFIVSLGSMDDNEIMLNLAALVILVLTIAGNIYINIFQVRDYHAANLTLGEKIGSTAIMLLLLVILFSTAVIIPTAKRYIESKYNQMHKRISNELVSFTGDELRVAVRRYWMLAESGSIQFVIARSVICVASSVMSLRKINTTGRTRRSYSFVTVDKLERLSQDLGRKVSCPA
ncbi:hypothetical protein CASFOL_018366 [Castilleja foliolosa]|uniref:Uncharacterized protein n=1 Tax=Castilleja foliolosa TaxID=1961234 RepID=A0ABD3D6I2_9LAMI